MTRDEFLKAVDTEFRTFPEGGYFTFNAQEKLVDATLKVAADRLRKVDGKTEPLFSIVADFLDSLRVHP